MTKKTKLFIFAAIPTLLAACTQENEAQYNPVEARITAGLSGPKTRAVDNRWDADHIGVMVLDETTTMGKKYKNVEYQTASTGTSADFVPTTAGEGIFFEDASSEFTFAAYAPFVSSYNASNLPGDNGKIRVNTEKQHPVMKQEDIDYVYAKGAKGSKENPVINFTDNTAAGGSDCSFKHKMARLILKVQTSATDGFTNPRVLRFANYKLGGLIHEGTFDILTGTATATGPVVNDWMLIESTYPTPTTNTVTYKCVSDYDVNTGVMTLSMILLPQTLNDFLTLEISPDDGENQIYSNKTLLKPALEAGYSYTYTITLKKSGLTISGSTIENWNDGGSHSGYATM